MTTPEAVVRPASDGGWLGMRLMWSANNRIRMVPDRTAMNTDTTAFTITYTEKDHSEPCHTIRTRPDSTNQALWIPIVEWSCDHATTSLLCGPCKDEMDPWVARMLSFGYILDCRECHAPVKLLGWKPIATYNL